MVHDWGPEDFESVEPEVTAEAVHRQYVQAQRPTPALLQVSFQRPPLHSMNPDFLRELQGVLAEVAFDSQLKVVTLTASGEYFSGGLDPASMRDEDLFLTVDLFHRLVRQVVTLNAVVVGRINGHAYGAGCVLAAVCDFSFAPEGARFGHPEVRYGHFTPLALLLYPRLMPRNRALYLSLSGDTVDAKTAAAWGLISWAFPADQWQAQADRFIQRLLGMSAAVLHHGRRAFWTSVLPNWDEAVAALEDLYLVQHANTADAREGLRAWLERRTPTWT
jgi:cyclohexa-1,5-dienecarbonyl-CoA hydratase